MHVWGPPHNFSLGPPKYLKIFIPVLNHDRIKVNIEDLLVFNRFFSLPLSNEDQKNVEIIIDDFCSDSNFVSLLFLCSWR